MISDDNFKRIGPILSNHVALDVSREEDENVHTKFSPISGSSNSTFSKICE